MGTLNIVGVADLNAVLKWIRDETIQKISDQEKENRRKLLDLISRYDFIKMVGSNSDKKYMGTVSCLVDGISRDGVENIF